MFSSLIHDLRDRIRGRLLPITLLAVSPLLALAIVLPFADWTIHVDAPRQTAQQANPKRQSSAQQLSETKPAANLIPIRIAAGPQLLVEEQLWVALEPKFAEDSKRRREISTECLKPVHTLSRLDLTDRIESFIDRVMGAGSHLQAVADTSSHRQWVERTFIAEVIRPKEIENAVLASFAELKSQMEARDNEFLISLRTDVAFDPTMVPSRSVPLEALNTSLHLASQRVIPAVTDALGKSMVASGVGTAGGMVAGSIANNMLRDEEGNTSALGSLVAGIIGIAVEEVGHQAINASLQTREELRAQLLEAAKSVHYEALVSGTVRDQWYQVYARIPNDHLDAVLDAVVLQQGGTRLEDPQPGETTEP